MELVVLLELPGRRVEWLRTRSADPILDEARRWPASAMLDALAEPRIFAEIYRLASLSPSTRAEIVVDCRGGRPRVPVTIARWTRHPEQAGRFELVRRTLLPGRPDPAGCPPAELLLHEAAHLGDGTIPPMPRHAYGRDGRHDLEEVIAWGAAFAEGWADYQSLHVPPGVEGYGALSDLVARPPPRLRMELPGRGLRWIGREERLAVHDLGNELAIAGILLALEGLVGREALEAAFLETNRLEVRTIAEFVGALARRHPDLRSAIFCLLLERTELARDRACLSEVLQGRIPTGVRVDRAPSR